MKQYDRVVGTFFRKVAKLERIADKNSAKINKLIEKSIRIKARIDLRIGRLQERNDELDAEQVACRKTAEKLKDFLA
jgi:hypothetical protein